jgi:hypothetical protein
VSQACGHVVHLRLDVDQGLRHIDQHRFANWRAYGATNASDDLVVHNHPACLAALDDVVAFIAARQKDWLGCRFPSLQEGLRCHLRRRISASVGQ